MTPRKCTRDGDSDSQNHTPATLSDTVRVEKKCSTPITSDRNTDKGGSDKWRECIDILIQTCQSVIQTSYISQATRYPTKGSRTTTCVKHGSTFRECTLIHSV